VLKYQVAADSLPVPADSSNPGMVSVGAVPWNSPLTLESFSSQGPTTDGRIKPDLAGPDGVSTTSYGTPFFGTSAASPHVAGAAALIKQANPGFGPAQIRGTLTATATDLGIPGTDNQFGAGRLDLGIPPVPCSGRPNIVVSVTPSSSRQLQVSLTPTGAGILLRSVQFGDPTVSPNVPVNSLIDILGQLGRVGGFTTDLPSRPTSLSITMRAAQPGLAMTAPLRVTDGCGLWQTLVGVGTTS
jgi:hypothetical protein